MPAVPAGRGGGRGGAAAGPTANPHVYLASVGKPLTVRAPGLVDAGGRGADGSAATTAAVATQPAHGKIVLNADGSFVYTPNVAFGGTDSFTFTVTRDGATSTPAKVSVIVR